MNDVFKPDCQNTTANRASLFKLSLVLQKINYGQKGLSYVAPNIWNKLSDFLKTTESINTYRVKKYFFRRMSNKENNIYSYF